MDVLNYYFYILTEVSTLYNILYNGPYVLVYKVDFNIIIIDYKGAIVAIPNKRSQTASSPTTS